MKKEHPQGIGDVDDVNKQRQAVCLHGKKSKKKKTNEGISFKQFLRERTYNDPSEPFYDAVKIAAEEARRLGKPTLVARKIEPKTMEETYVPVEVGGKIPAGFDIWAEITPRGKVRRMSIH